MLDATGKQARLFGIDVTGLGRGVGLPGQEGLSSTGCPGWQIPDPNTAANIEKFGFNTVRLPLSWANLEPEPPTVGPAGQLVRTYNQRYISAVDSVVQSFTSRGIAVIIEMAQSHWSPAFTDISTAKSTIKCQGVGMPIWLYPNAAQEGEIQARLDFFTNVNNVQQGYIEAWRYVAQRYAPNSMVIGTDLMNEPYTKGKLSPQDLHLNDLYQKVGTAIRSVNQRILLVFQDSKADPSGHFALSGPPPFPNEIYEFHMYADTWNPEGLQLSQSYQTRAQSWDVPLWIGEFDAFGYASPFGAGPDWQVSLREMMAWCRGNAVSWSEFTYGDRWFLQSGSDIPKPGLLNVMAAYW